MPGDCLWPVAGRDWWLPVTGDCLCLVAFASSVCFFSVWRCFSESSFILFLLFLNIRIIILSRTHPCRQNLPARDASPQDFSSLQTESSRQGCIAPGFFIPADRISSSRMHRLGIFHPTDKISPPGMHRPEIFHPYRQNFLGRDASPPQLYSRLPGAPRSPPCSPQFTSTLAGRPRT